MSPCTKILISFAFATLTAACATTDSFHATPHPRAAHTIAKDDIASHRSHIAAQLNDQHYRDIQQAVHDFLARLNDDQRATVVLPYDSDYRTRGFCYVLAHCKDDFAGLRMRDLNANQKIALNQLLMKSLSGAGYSRAIQTMNREFLLEEMEARYFGRAANAYAQGG